MFRGFHFVFLGGPESCVFQSLYIPKHNKNCAFIFARSVKWDHRYAFVVPLFACGMFLSLFERLKENTLKRVFFFWGGGLIGFCHMLVLFFLSVFIFLFSSLNPFIFLVFLYFFRPSVFLFFLGRVFPLVLISVFCPLLLLLLVFFFCFCLLPFFFVLWPCESPGKP